MPSINDDFTVDIQGKYTTIRFATLSGNDTTFPNDNISVVIAREGDDEVVFQTGVITLSLDYTRDTGDSSASIDDYINSILSKIRIQDVILFNSSDVANNEVDGLGSIDRFGRNPDMDIASSFPQDVWNGQGHYTGQDATGSEILDIFSSSTDDDVAGIGALTIRIFGLKTSTSTAYESEDVILTGTSIVNSASAWYRINLGEILTAGSTGWNVGTITIRQTTTTANVFAVMEATANQTAIAAYTVPFATTGFLGQISLQTGRSDGNNGSILVTLRVRDTANNGVFASKSIVDVQNGGIFTQKYQYPIVLPALSDIKISCHSVSHNNMALSGGYTIFLFIN